MSCFRPISSSVTILFEPVQLFRRPKATDDRPFALGRFPSDHVGVLEIVKESGRDVKLFINIPNHLGHSPFDTAWSSKRMQNVIVGFGGFSVKPMPNAHGKGGKGKGKGVKDGIGPDHHWNRQFHRGQGQGQGPHPFFQVYRCIIIYTYIFQLYRTCTNSRHCDTHKMHSQLHQPHLA